MQKIERNLQILSFSRFTRYFLEVARSGSIRKAAETLHVSASAIDRQILMAEESLGVPLFERLPNGMRLTAAGEILISQTQEWHKDYQKVIEQISELQGLKRGHVDIAVIDALADGIIPETVAAITKDLPGISYGIHVRDNIEVINTIMSGEVDFGLLLDPVPNMELTVIAFVDIPLGIAMRPGHSLEKEKGLKLNQARGYPIIMPSKPLMIYERAIALSASTGFDANQHINCNNIRMIRSLIKEDAGIGILSWLDVMTDVLKGDLSFVPLTDSIIKPMILSLCVATRRRLSKAANVSIKYLETKMTNMQLPSRN